MSVLTRFFRPTNRSSSPSSAAPKLVVIGDTGQRLEGIGKMLPEVFLPILKKELGAKGIDVLVLTDSTPLEFGGDHFSAGTFILPVYHDEVVDDLYYRHLGLVEANAARRGWVFLHPISTGRSLGSKPETHRILNTVVPMPELHHDGLMFSNLAQSCSAPVTVVEASDCDPTRYNTRFIDTTTEFRGKNYFTSLRIMAVGTEVATVFMRCRPVTDGPVSVHDKDTPLDADLLCFLHERLVGPQMPAIRNMAQKIGSKIGLGFYAHDVLPERGTGKLYLCETGLKFHDWTIRDHLEPIADRLPFFAHDISDACVHRAVRLFADHLLVPVAA